MYQGHVSYNKVRYPVCWIIFVCKYHSCAGGSVNITPSNIYPPLHVTFWKTNCYSPFGLEWLIDLGNNNCLHVFTNLF